MLQEGSKAREFKAVDQNGVEHTLKDYAGKWLLLYFYPEDDTPGCTKEACMIRDYFQDFVDNGISVLGVSADSQESHANFAQKYSLPFPLLADPDKNILNAYEAWGEKQMFGKKYMGIFRISYLINPQGVIEKTYPNVKPEQHAQEILEDFQNLSGS